NGGYNYVCATWVDITGSIFSNNSGGTSDNAGTITTNPEPNPDMNPSDNNASPSNGTSSPDNSNTVNNPGNTNNNDSGNTSSSVNSNVDQTQTDFEKSIASFPEDYKVHLRKLHASHPNWKFIAKETGVDWNTALSKQSRDGVSLINGAYPLSYRDINPYSFKAKDQSRPLYSGASISSGSIGSASSNTAVSLLDEVFNANNGSDDAKFIHIKTASGQTGYIQGSVTTENYSNEINGTVKGGYTNIRKGAGTGYGKVGGANTGDKVSIVLTAKASDGVVWFKIKQGNGFGYICSKFVKVDDSKAPSSNTKQTISTSSTTNTDVVFGTLNQSASYRMGPSDIFKEAGTLTSGQNVTIISSVKNIDNSNWYKIAVSGKVYYIRSSYVTPSGQVKDGEASVSGKVHDYLNYRSSYDITNKPVGTFPKNTDVVITGAINSGNYNWYRVQYKGKTYYAAANWITVSDQKYDGKEATPVSDAQSVEAPAGGIESLKGVGRFTASGTYIPKDGSTWFNASSQVVGYYMDPRNFINENNIYMFEDLSYQSYQSQAAVSKIISGTALERNGFMASWFVSAGKENGMSPIALAARARQETGGGSIAISGYIFPDGKYAYNPYNIGAYSNANPVMRGLEYAKKQGWDTKQKAVFGGAKFIASGYIKQGQNSVYFQRFNVANGAAKVGTHQYMTNISACYTESISTKNSYSAYGITNESLVFVIPIYTNMPASTALPH
ncbi:MAG: SH3 domain-containing protein, partial [Mogibacterium diversum]|uniref:SH3 domain-containing protein n=1 Tax=Mogibacterium diversum TaxID=114527 RepID=UPI001CB3A7FA